MYTPNQHLSAGAREDITTLLQRTTILFDEYGTLRFRHFADIFQDMKFSLIFCGRTSFKELYELTDDLMVLAKQEAAASHNKTPIRAAACYLLYALYFKQPLRPKVRLFLGAFGGEKKCFRKKTQVFSTGKPRFPRFLNKFSLLPN